MLDDSDGNELAILLNSVLRFVQVNCEVILQLAEKAESRRKNSDTLLLTQFTDNAPETVRPKDDGFEIMANVIWDEIARSIMEELGSTIFAAGQPDDFHAVRSFCQEICSPLANALINITELFNYTKLYHLPGAVGAIP